MAIRTVVVGASGYVGAELIRILWGHPDVELVGAFARRSAGARLDTVLPQLAGLTEIIIGQFDADQIAAMADVAFTALPHGQSAHCAGQLLDRGVTVIDLSADFRLEQSIYSHWYGEHPRPELIAAAVCGFPEVGAAQRKALADARLVACPGCYVTASTLAIAPLLKVGLIEASPILIDAKSGASGAGRGLSQGTHLPEVGESIRAYNVAGTHRHTPEIEALLQRATGHDCAITFTPHLVPMSRGILVCGYGRPTDSARPLADYQAALKNAWHHEPFVSVLADDRLPDTAHVRGSNRAHVAVRFDSRTGTVIALSAIDNLVKGASGQAVQCFNLVQGLDETRGLNFLPLFP